jgi:hypothetical protein
MKPPILLACAAAALASTSTQAQNPQTPAAYTVPSGVASLSNAAGRPRLTGSIEGKSIGTGKVTQENWKTDWGSYDRNYTRMQHVEVTVTAWGAGEGNVEVEWIWFGRGLEKGSPRVILNRGKSPITIKAGAGPKSLLIHSGAIAGSVQNYSALGERYADGEKIEGWYIRLLIDGKPAGDASNQTFLTDLARNAGKLAAIEDLTPDRKKSNE